MAMHAPRGHSLWMSPPLLVVQVQGVEAPLLPLLPAVQIGSNANGGDPGFTKRKMALVVTNTQSLKSWFV